MRDSIKAYLGTITTARKAKEGGGVICFPLMKFTSELYRCVVLTVIAVSLLFIVWKIQTKRIVVQVGGGSIDVENTVDVEVKNDVKLEQPVEVEGTVEIDR